MTNGEELKSEREVGNVVIQNEMESSSALGGAVPLRESYGWKRVAK